MQVHKCIRLKTTDYMTAVHVCEPLVMLGKEGSSSFDEICRVEQRVVIFFAWHQSRYVLAALLNIARFQAPTPTLSESKILIFRVSYLPVI